MVRTVRDLMITDPVRLPVSAPATVAAASMREFDVGNVLVEEDGRAVGILTDRDIVVRGVADHADLDATTVGSLASKNLVSVNASDPIDRAVDIMRDIAVRRLLVVEGDEVVGIISLGDLAIARDPDSVLASISAADANT